MKCCDYYGHNCNQGRACPLHTDNGGTRVSDDDSARLDPPLFEAEEAAGWGLAALFYGGILALALIGAVSVIF